MSGKSYTMREMKSIVEYLTVHHLYSETRGRKMWVDFANSDLTKRTWQSLKETFLKRILPDITNPYYRLDPDQILSFKRGLNLTQKDKKLELRPVNSSINKGANDDIDQPSTSKKNTEEHATGEDTQCSKVVHNRASTETLVLNTCYQTAEDMQSDLERANAENVDKTTNKSKPALKSIRDYIEYTEPLTPMLQEVLHDFATDEDCSDTEPPMQIDENYVAQDEISDTPENPPSSQSILKPNKTQNTVKLTTLEEKDNVKQLGNAKLVNENTEEPVVPDETAFSQLEDVMVLVDEALAKDIDKELSRNIESQDKEASSNQSIPMTDSLLPNNQEAIKIASPIRIQSPILPSPHGKSDQGIEQKESEVDKKLSNSKSNLDSDQAPEQKGSEEVIKTDSNKQIANKKETTQEEPPAQNKESPKNSSINDNKVYEIHSDNSTGTKARADNPCLQSVSLFEQQLVTTQYSDSDYNNKENANDQPETKAQNTAETNKSKDLNNDVNKVNKDQYDDKENAKEKTTEGVILLNSRTTSESSDDSEIPHRPLARSSLKIQKDKKLANVFGFSNGGAPKSRRLNGRKRTTSHRKVQSDSSEWTSTSDSEYVSPPHGRRNRYARRYQKPRAARIMSLEEEGGLFVMLGKKVYPLVKDGKAVKNYVTYLPDSDPEEDDSYWKSKYIEERKRTDELKKKLGHPKSNGVLDKEEKECSISVSSVTSPLIENGERLRQESVSIQGNELMRLYSGATEKQPSKETLKIKFTKNDQEVQLEGHWQHINPVLAQVVSIFHKDSEKKAETVTCVELSSGNTTPITPTVTHTVAPVDEADTGVRDKVNELESAIFKEIEEKDKKDTDIHEAVEQEEGQEQNVSADNAEKLSTIQENVEKPQEEQPNITQRKKRGRPKKEVSPALAVAQSPAKKRKQSVERNKILEELKALEVDNSTPNVGRLTRSPRTVLNGITPKARTRKSSTKLQPKAPVENSATPVTEGIEDDEVRYKFPSPEPETITKANTSKVSPKKHLPNTASPESLSHHSTTSSQGYQDSDASPFHINIRRKRRLSVSMLPIKGRKMKRKQRSRSYPLLKRVNSDSDSSYTITFKTIGKESAINSEVYRSDSYQFLMPRSRIMERLEKIDEANDNETDTLANEIRELRDEILKANDSNKTDHASSSILSLPLSPELSIVENLSVSQSAIAEISDQPTINEIEGNNAHRTCNNKYFMSEVDVSMPLMEQDCELKENYKKHLMSALSDLSDGPNSAGRNLSRDSSMRMSITSESILRSYPAINVELPDSLDKRLERLLLESAQKPQNRKENMEVDTQVKKKGSRKRCSTPHKKKTVKSKKKADQEPVIVEEESKARCSRGGRRSCPPSVNIVYCEQNPPDNLEINIRDESIDVTAVTKRKRIKKDVIKVKIVKPKDKPQKKKSPKKKLQNVSRSSVIEGDNESGVFLHGFEDSSELIHNHSETCLQIGDCMGQDDSDSVEFIETTTKSIISLNCSSSEDSENKEDVSGNTMESGKTSPELYCDNAQCATDLRETRAEVQSADSGNTMYFTPFASRCNSALTDDLSDDPPLPKPNFRPSKWYLLSEDETNTNYFDVQEKESPVYGANLQQIFPITCAIPDLSSITEMSEKSENSQKASLDAEEIRRAKK